MQLLALAAALCVVAAARPANKAYTNLTIYIINDATTLTVDHFALGARMAVAEINNNPNIMPDATLRVVDTRPPSYLTSLARLYEFAVDLCVNQGPYAFLGPYASYQALPFAMIYPMFYRYNLAWYRVSLYQFALFKYFGWTTIGIINQNVGIWPVAAKVFKKTFADHGITVATSITIADYSGVGSYYEQLKPSIQFAKSTGIRVFNLLTYNTIIGDILLTANRTGIWGPNYGIQMGPYPTDPIYQAWDPKVRAFISSTLADPVQMAQYLVLNPSITSPNTVGYPGTFFYLVPYQQSIAAGYDSVYSIVKAWDALINAAGADAQALVSGAVKTQLSDVLTQLQSPDTLIKIKMWPNGDPNAQVIIAYQYQGDSFDTYSVVGNYSNPDAEGVYTLTIDPSKFTWAGNRSFYDTPISFIPTPEDFVSWSDTSTRAMLVISGIACLCSLLCGVLVAVFRTSPVIKAASPNMLLVSALGLAVIPLNVFTLIGKEKALACKLRAFPVAIGLTLALAPIFAKSYRLYMIFYGHEYLSRFSHKIIRDEALYLIMTAIVGVMVAIVGGFVATSPIQSSQVYLDGPNKYLWTCVSGGGANAGVALIILWLALLMVGIGTLGYLIRGIPDQFNDVKENISAMFIIALFSLVCLVQGMMSNQDVIKEFQFEAVAIAAGVLYVSVTLVGTPVYRHVTSNAIFTLKTRSTSASSKSASEPENDAKVSPGKKAKTLSRTTDKNSATASDAPSSNSTTAKLDSSQETAERKSVAEHISKKTAKTLEKTWIKTSSIKMTSARLQPNEFEKFKVICSKKVLINKSAVVRTGEYLQQWRRVKITLFLEPANVLQFFFPSDPEKPAFLHLFNLRSVRALIKTDFGFERAVELVFERVTILIPFEEPLQMYAWADAISCALVAFGDPAQLKTLQIGEHISELQLVAHAKHSRRWPNAGVKNKGSVPAISITDSGAAASK
ncbi:hypothetical protein HK105_205849 [Polyrhizophydium stewartii]|uniref:G-protein coupled receptors family 3 profile domain-containing protein n=1 Tax=Polyrhizophydium stewartii TaxID=2732419 RepID=A0ABR4N5D9_9FUNG